MTEPQDDKSQPETTIAGPSTPPREVSRQPVGVTRNPSHWVAPVALVVALAAVALAVWALMKAPSETASGPKQAGDPKERACTAFQTVTGAVRLQTHADLGPEPVAVEAVAANARLALFGGGQYLLSRIGPDTPADLADAVRSFANNLEDIGMNALAGYPNSDPAQANRLKAGEEASAKVAGLCK